MYTNIRCEHQSIINRSVEGARGELFKHGYINTYCEIRDDGGSCIVRASFEDDVDKNMFANIVRSAAIIRRATGIALVSEAWTGSKGWPGAPSEDPDRTESVVVVVETAKGRSVTVLNIGRDDNGDIVYLDHSETSWQEGARSAGDRFDSLLAPIQVQNDERIRFLAQKVLHENGITLPGDPLPGLGGRLMGRAQ